MSDLLFFKDDEMIHRAKAKPWKASKAAKFQDTFDLAYSNVAAEEMRDDELPALVGTSMLYDVECFSNFFMVLFRSMENNKTIHFEHPMNLAKLEWVLRNFCIIGYNSRNYDILLLQLALKGATCKELFKASCEIIYDNLRDYQFRKKHKLPDPSYDHIDLIEVAPLQGSLKLYAGRLHTSRMQDLPIDPMTPLKEEDKQGIREYCLNDLASTGLLVGELEPALLLRCQMSHQYDVDLRSKSDAQIAEAVISSEITKVNGTRPKRPDVDFESHQYRIPEFIGYRTPVLRQMLEVVRNAKFSLDGQGYINMPKEIDDLRLSIGSSVYKMGIGGLHSTEKSAAHKVDSDTLLLDCDVESYYPATILNQRLFPKHLGQAFLRVYKSIVDRRLEAKHTGNKVVADSLKITINGSFGKFGSKWSVLYAPDLLIQVTITGQLALLMLIEMIEDLGIPVVSANTDGVLIKCSKARYGELQQRVEWWQAITGYKTEEARYRGLWGADVNNYFAHKLEHCPKCKKWAELSERHTTCPVCQTKLEHGFKVKGRYAERGSAGNSRLSKNPENLICNDAILALIEKGTPIEQTIRECSDIRRFVTIRKVTGGARKSNIYLGKVIRWYYSTEMKGEINRATKGDKIPNTDAARPLMELPSTLPTDIDYERYIDATIETLHDIGYYPGLSKASKRCLGPLFQDDGQDAYHLNG